MPSLTLRTSTRTLKLLARTFLAVSFATCAVPSGELSSITNKVNDRSAMSLHTFSMPKISFLIFLDSLYVGVAIAIFFIYSSSPILIRDTTWQKSSCTIVTVSYTHLRAHETVLDLVCRLLLEKKKNNKKNKIKNNNIQKTKKKKYNKTNNK